jgi:Ion channel
VNPAHSSSNRTAAPGSNLASPLGGSRYSAVKLVVALALLFVSAPFIEDLPRGDLIEGVLITLVMLSAVLAVSGRRRSLVAALVLVTPAIIGKWMNHFYPRGMPAGVFLVSSAVFFAFVLAQLLRFILRAPRVDGNVLSAGISGFLVLGLVWIPLYVFVARLNPAAFSLPGGPAAGGTMDGFNGFYFSLTTLCTVGYGDVTPVSKIARMLAVTEAITGLFYMTIFISRLVSIHTATHSAIHVKPDNHQI